MRMIIILVAEILQTEAAVLARAAIETLIALGRSLIAAYLT
jgi:hypothetical protein